MKGPAVFETLSGLLRPYAEELIVKSDNDSNFYLEESRSTGKPQMFAAVQFKKNYVSYHLYPVYVRPDLLNAIGPGLRSRMQGKSCFNFTKPEQIPVGELAALTRSAFASLGRA